MHLTTSSQVQHHFSNLLHLNYCTQTFKMLTSKFASHMLFTTLGTHSSHHSICVDQCTGEKSREFELTSSCVNFSVTANFQTKADSVIISPTIQQSRKRICSLTRHNSHAVSHASSCLQFARVFSALHLRSDTIIDQTMSSMLVKETRI